MTDPAALSDEQTLILQKLDDLITGFKSIEVKATDDDDVQNLSSSEVRKNISVFSQRVECFHQHYCYNIRELSLDDLEIFKSIQF